ncbi:protein PAXX isoform X1 [Coturnix japonica]|uniref:protein PAXX isoform X1 n=1 Tax=Coturnix japonica TaxID=93934 RepID=UPI0013A5EF37|nr:protein PAXX isoform X1 [Coturnix japonica]
MAEPSGPLGVLRDGADRYICYCRPAPDPGSAATVYVTDALEVWAGRLGGDPAEDGVAELRAALCRGAASLGLRDGAAALRLREGNEALLLPRLPAAEARAQLRALLFAMAARVLDLEERLEVLGALSYSPEKRIPQSQKPVLPDPSPRKNRAAGSALPAKRKIPGESLINPGFKRYVLLHSPVLGLRSAGPCFAGCTARSGM